MTLPLPTQSPTEPNDTGSDARPARHCALHALAWLNVALHLLGLVLAAVGMRPGSPLTPLPERLDYLAAAPPGWTLGWMVWMLCAAALIAFLAVAAHRLGSGRELSRLAVTFAVVGAGFDLLCDALFIVALPMLAAQRPVAEAVFLLVERSIGVGSLVVANGFYSLAVLLLTLALRGRSGVRPWTIAVGLAVAGCGFLLVGAGFTGEPWHAAWATLPTMALHCVWVVLVARNLEAT